MPEALAVILAVIYLVAALFVLRKKRQPEVDEDEFDFDSSESNGGPQRR